MKEVGICAAKSLQLCPTLCDPIDPIGIARLGQNPGERDSDSYLLVCTPCLAVVYISFLCTDSSEKAMAPHSSTLAWKIPWMEEPGGLQSMGSLRVRHD